MGKRYVCFFATIILCFLSSCMIEDKEISHSSPDVEVTLSETKKLIANEKYYKITEEYNFEYRYYIYNSKGEEVLGGKTEGNPPTIKVLYDNIIDISEGKGTGITLHKYYNISLDKFSESFSYVVAVSDKLIAYMYIPESEPLKNRKLVIHNIFDKESCSKEYLLDFSGVDTPVISASFLNDNAVFQITYLSGENQIETTINIDLK